MQQAGGRWSGRAMTAVVVVGLTLFMACTNDDDDGADDRESSATSTTTTSSPATEPEDASETPRTVVQGPVPDASTGTGPVDAEHPCGALSVGEVSEVVVGVAGANRNGTSCHYVTEAGDDALAVDLPPAYSDDPRDASAALLSITMQFEPGFDPTGQGCDPVDLGGGGATVDEAYYCTRSAADEPATLVLRSGMTVVQLLDLIPSSPPEQARLVTLAQTLRPRLP